MSFKDIVESTHEDDRDGDSAAAADSPPNLPEEAAEGGCAVPEDAAEAGAAETKAEDDSPEGDEMLCADALASHSLSLSLSERAVSNLHKTTRPSVDPATDLETDLEGGTGGQRFPEPA